MTFRFIHTAVLAAVLALVARVATAAPVPFTGELPLTNDDVVALRARLVTDEFLRTMDFLGAIRVFEDDASTPTQPIFYLAPFFTADTRQEIIGGQEIATDLLGYLDDLDALLASFDASQHRIARLEAIRGDHLALAARVAAQRDQLPSTTTQRLLDYAVTSNPAQRELDAVPARITAAMSKLPSALCDDIMAQILKALDRLGARLTDDERRLAGKNPLQFMLTVMPGVRAQLANMLLGIRHATFVSGMTAEQVRLLGNYRRVRPDVSIRALPVWVLRVVPLASIADTGGDGTFVAAPEMIRGVNAATGGICGLQSSCTVILELTELGARSALLSTRGASIMPALFVGDVLVAQDPTPIECDVPVIQRQLALPFGMGLLGDREIVRRVEASAACRGGRAPATKAAAALLLAGAHRNLMFDATQISAARRGQLPKYLTQVAAEGAQVVDKLGSLSAVLRLVDPDSYFQRFARSYYTRLTPRFPAELIAALLLRSGASPETQRFDFDGIAIACWKEGLDGAPYLSACPNEVPEEPEILGAAAAILEARDCEKVRGLPACAASIRMTTPPDDRRYLWLYPH